ncbi:hypothetical protein SRB5_43800 [Streptomyces sp. RB5]|uniref:HTH luxR-type domain-containing protein n=1 Tax=Streptomyces smaragdinus TaxID=2585196 RepID=A0A7K0CL57_9ACTN|nr:LuxR family transcriptional regulator [Streptomyces smaragdinus]MQY14218.1 hypothetical protein [Streptomyces smaragdinus]
MWGESGRLWDELDAGDARALLRVVEECGGARDGEGFREGVLEALARFFGYRHTTFFRGPTRAELFADPNPAARGRAVRLVGRYVEEAHRFDPFAQPGAGALFEAYGVVSLDAVRQLPRSRGTQRYLDDFLGRGGVRAKLVVPLPGAGGIGLLAEDAGAFGVRDLLVAHALRRQLAGLARLHLAPERPAGPTVRLTARQAAVAALVGEGRTNEEIAAALTVGVGTVKKHLTAAMRRAGCRSRVQLAMAWRDGRVGSGGPSPSGQQEQRGQEGAGGVGQEDRRPGGPGFLR